MCVAWKIMKKARISKYSWSAFQSMSKNCLLHKYRINIYLHLKNQVNTEHGIKFIYECFVVNAEKCCDNWQFRKNNAFSGSSTLLPLGMSAPLLTPDCEPWGPVDFPKRCKTLRNRIRQQSLIHYQQFILRLQGECPTYLACFISSSASCCRCLGLTGFKHFFNLNCMIQGSTTGLICCGTTAAFLTLENLLSSSPSVAPAPL